MQGISELLTQRIVELERLRAVSPVRRRRRRPREHSNDTLSLSKSQGGGHFSLETLYSRTLAELQGEIRQISHSNLATIQRLEIRRAEQEREVPSLAAQLAEAQTRLGGLERQELEASRKYQDQRDELSRREAELEQNRAVVASLQGTIHEQQQRLAGQASKCSLSLPRRSRFIGSCDLSGRTSRRDATGP